MGRRLDLVGSKFGELVVLRPAPKGSNYYKGVSWVCLCTTCNTECIFTGPSLLAKKGPVRRCKSCQRNFISNVNKRRASKYLVDGVELTKSELAQLKGTSVNTISKLLKSGLSGKEVLMVSVRSRVSFTKEDSPKRLSKETGLSYQKVYRMIKNGISPEEIRRMNENGRRR